MSRALPAALHGLGISYRQLDYWVRQGYLRVPEAHPGCGYERAWPREEVNVARRLAALVNVGFRPDAAAELARRPGDLIELDRDITLRLRREPATVEPTDLPFTADPYVDAAVDWLRGVA